jgi:hypothetical protein
MASKRQVGKPRGVASIEIVAIGEYLATATEHSVK